MPNNHRGQPIADNFRSTPRLALHLAMHLNNNAPAITQGVNNASWAKGQDMIDSYRTRRNAGQDVSKSAQTLQDTLAVRNTMEHYDSPKRG